MLLVALLFDFLRTTTCVFLHMCVRKISFILTSFLVGRGTPGMHAVECSWMRKVSRTICYTVNLTANCYIVSIWQFFEVPFELWLKRNTNFGFENT